ELHSPPTLIEIANDRCIVHDRLVEVLEFTDVPEVAPLHLVARGFTILPNNDAIIIDAHHTLRPVDTQSVFIRRHLGAGGSEHKAANSVIYKIEVDGDLTRPSMRLVGILHFTADASCIAHQHAHHRNLVDPSVQMRSALISSLPAPRRATEL